MRKKILYPLLIIAEIIAAFLYYSYQKCKYSEIAREFFTETIPYMLSLDTNCQKVCIVFGLNL